MIAEEISLDVALWNTKLVGQFLCRAPQVVADRIAPLPGFPRAIRLPTAKGKSPPLYKAREVIAWAEQFQEKVQPKRGAMSSADSL